MHIRSTVKKTLLRTSPESLIVAYHSTLSFLGALYYGFPSKKMIVIGVTGTKGKTSTANFIWSCLNAANIKTGIISTANIRIGDTELLNSYHMTMPGRFAIPKLMRDMVRAGCTTCVIETTSEGLKQGRHRGLYYDIAIFTNLSPEHLPSHGGSFERYKAAKAALFTSLSRTWRKTLLGKKVPTMIIANADSEHAGYYVQFPADKKITYGLHHGDIRGKNIESYDQGIRFTVGDAHYEAHILGEFNVYNILPALIVGQELGASSQALIQGIASLQSIPGRMEVISCGQNFTVIVDYAHEKQSMTALTQSAQKLKRNPSSKILILLGAEGGGRDKTKRPLMGEVVGKNTDIVIVTNVDPYDDDPRPIIEDIAIAAEATGKKRGSTLFTIEDRQEAIRYAFSLAQEHDIVLITGKGAEQSMIIDGISRPWDDRVIAREELEKLTHSKKNNGSKAVIQ